jgi:hypothetical protein
MMKSNINFTTCSKYELPQWTFFSYADIIVFEGVGTITRLFPYIQAIRIDPIDFFSFLGSKRIELINGKNKQTDKNLLKESQSAVCGIKTNGRRQIIIFDSIQFISIRF